MVITEDVGPPSMVELNRRTPSPSPDDGRELARRSRFEEALGDEDYREARELVNRKVKFVRHVVIWAACVLFLLATAGLDGAIPVGLLWGIVLAAQGFSNYFAPTLRRRWIQEEVDARLALSASDERRALEGRHARSIETLSASLAHEIRNPITAAKSLVQQMGEDPSSPENVEYARVALEELDRVERSISHLLRFAREEDLVLGEVRMGEILDSALETFSGRIAARGVRVERSVDTDRPFPGDAEKIRRVAINLISNALDALDDPAIEAPRIDVSAGENLAGTEAWLRIKDNGPGIPEEKREAIWTPFFTSKSHGTGLGLAISKKLVDAHGGAIEVHSTAGAGSEFVVRFPRGAGKGAVRS